MKLPFFVLILFSIFFMGVAGQEDDEDSEPEPEPEGEPEPEIECYVCTYEDDEAACAANQTDDSNVETCAPGMHCSTTYFKHDDGTHLYQRGCSKPCSKSCFAQYSATDGNRTFEYCTDCCSSPRCNAQPLVFSSTTIVLPSILMILVFFLL